jgi:hypothetical protein
MSNNTNVRGGGIGFFGLLAVAFIVLKLTRVISWSWVWILAPLWAPVCLAVLVVICWIIGEIVKDKSKK